MPDTLTVLMPTGAQQTGSIAVAPRPKSLAGLRVGLLDNGKEFSDVVLDALAEALRARPWVTDIKFWRKGFPAKGAPFIAEMAAEPTSPSRASATAVRRRRGASSTRSISRRPASRGGADQPLVLPARPDRRRAETAT